MGLSGDWKQKFVFGAAKAEQVSPAGFSGEKYLPMKPTSDPSYSVPCSSLSLFLSFFFVCVSGLLIRVIVTVDDMHSWLCTTWKKTAQFLFISDTKCTWPKVLKTSLGLCETIFLARALLSPCIHGLFLPQPSCSSRNDLFQWSAWCNRCPA